MNVGERYDVGIIGGGVMGLACAWRLAEAGARVALFERGSIGREASWAAGGMLAPQCEDAHHPPGGQDNESREAMFRLCLASRELYPAFLRDLENASGLEVEACLNQAVPGDNRIPGFLYVCRDAHDPAPLAFARQKERGYRVEERSWEGKPAFWLPDEGQVENRDLVPALKKAAEKAGAVLFENEPLRSISPASAGRQLTTSARIVNCENVLLCAGSWSSQISGWPADCVPPVHPVKGEVLSIRMAEPPPHVIYSGSIYIIPRRDGHVLIGATVENAGFDKQIDNGKGQELLRQASHVWTKWIGTSIDEHWAGLRPGTPDNLPILGRAGAEGLFVAGGHFRNGILLTPITAQLMAACILNGGDVDPQFGIERFAKKENRDRAPELCASY